MHSCLKTEEKVPIRQVPKKTRMKMRKMKRRKRKIGKQTMKRRKRKIQVPKKTRTKMRKWTMDMRKRKMRMRKMKRRKRKMGRRMMQMRKRKMRKRTMKRRKRKMLTLRLGLPWGHHSTPDPPGLEAPRTQASAGPEVPCPSSHPQDLRVERGEGGPLPQVTWRHITWSIANPRPPVLVPGSRVPREAVRSGYQEAPKRIEEEEKAEAEGREAVRRDGHPSRGGGEGQALAEAEGQEAVALFLSKSTVRKQPAESMKKVRPYLCAPVAHCFLYV